jgi:hypothetical protein
MRAPFAPTMSRGSRATQVKPEALTILLGVIPLKPLLLCGRPQLCVCLCIQDFLAGIFFGAFCVPGRTGPRTGAQYSAESTLRERVGIFWQLTTSSIMSMNKNMIMSMITTLKA